MSLVTGIAQPSITAPQLCCYTVPQAAGHEPRPGTGVTEFIFFMRELKQKFTFWQAYDRESYLTIKQQSDEAHSFVRAMT